MTLQKLAKQIEERNRHAIRASYEIQMYLISPARRRHLGAIIVTATSITIALARAIDMMAVDTEMESGDRLQAEASGLVKLGPTKDL